MRRVGWWLLIAGIVAAHVVVFGALLPYVLAYELWRRGVRWFMR